MYRLEPVKLKQLRSYCLYPISFRPFSNYMNVVKDRTYCTLSFYLINMYTLSFRYLLSDLTCFLCALICFLCALICFLCALICFLCALICFVCALICFLCALTCFLCALICCLCALTCF